MAGYPSVVGRRIARDNFYAKLKTILEYVESDHEYGTNYKFNYYSGDIKEHFEKIYSYYQEAGFNKFDFMHLMSQSGFSFSKIKRQMSGVVPMLAIEYLEYTKALNADLNGNLEMPVYTSYIHSVERDRLIIRKNVAPKFYINMNINDFYDYEVDFSAYKKAEFGERKMWKFFRLALKSYFITDESSKFIETNKFKILFKKKLYRNELGKEPKSL